MELYVWTAVCRAGCTVSVAYVALEAFSKLKKPLPIQTSVGRDVQMQVTIVI